MPISETPGNASFSSIGRVDVTLHCRSNMFRPRVLAFLTLLIAFARPAHAGLIELSATIAVDTGAWSGEQGWENIQYNLPVTPFTVQDGDTVRAVVRFANGGTLRVYGGDDGIAIGGALVLAETTRPSFAVSLESWASLDDSAGNSLASTADPGRGNQLGGDIGSGGTLLPRPTTSIEISGFTVEWRDIQSISTTDHGTLPATFNGLRFNLMARDFGDPYDTPTPPPTTVPEPSSVLLFGSWLALFAGARRRSVR